ncbi:MAG: GNAT family N-acetyltransferase, partial [Anaerolineae bacterium]|nr:GNAT family N-acetyltransferase [Anaerolineae bacterium]
RFIPSSSGPSASQTPLKYPMRRIRQHPPLASLAGLGWAGRRPAPHGRVLYGAVLPGRRGQGIGSQLLHQAMLTAHQHGWQSLTFGPFPTVSLGAKFLKRNGAKAGQSYLLYQLEF